MNHVYRLVWNRSLNALVAVAENAGSGGKAGSPRQRKSGRTLTTRLAPVARAVLLALGLGPVAALALPTGGQVVSGSAGVSQSGNTLTVTQTSHKAILNWQRFGIASGETVNFDQPGAGSVALNRVLGSSASDIYGHLNATGQVFLVNPNGVYFAPGAQVNVGGLVASTLGISNQDFLNGNYTFSGSSTAGVVNDGTITTPQGGYVAFIGDHVSNNGDIATPGGTTALGAGGAVDLTLAGNTLLSFKVSGAALNALAKNGGLIKADGGTVLLTTQARDALLKTVVNNTGVIQAQTVANHHGTIELLGGDSGTTQVAGTLDASAPNGGDGGHIETSGAHVKVANDVTITTKATSGTSGSWLIDPVDFTIAASGGDMTGSALSTSLGNGNVTIQSTSGSSGTAGDINVNDTVSWSANTLTLKAQNNININSTINATGTAGLALDYGQASSSGGSSVYNVNAPVNLVATASFTTQKGTNSANAITWTIIDSLGAAGSTTGTDLQGINGNLSGHYVLGANIDASTTSGWNGGVGFAPIGNNATKFTGVFDGLGHTITGLTVNRPTSSNAGLFGVVGSGGAVRNVGLVGGSITGDYNVGGLMGSNFNGTISNAYATGSVSGHGSNGFLGGLVGINNGVNSTISNAYATGSVNGNVSLSSNQVGGLVGGNNGTISNAYATGNVIANTGPSTVGGLVANNAGTISNAYATGSVLGGSVDVGGLVGNNAGTISNGYWDTTTTGQATSSGSASSHGLTTAQLAAALPTGFSSGVWDNGGNQTTPYLKANAGFSTVSGHVILGTDTASSPSYYGVIQNMTQLQNINSTGLSGHYVLGSNLTDTVTTGSGFTPIGDGTTKFTGVFDGLGHTITNLYINRAGTSDVGLFGVVGASGIVRNIGLVGGSVTGKSRVGELVGENYIGTITDAYATGSVSGSGSFVGGLVGSNNQGTISKAYATGTVSGSGNFVGGLAGVNNSASITDAYATGSVSGNDDVGGLVGSNGGGGTSIINAYATGSVSGSGYHVGGLSGYNSNDVTYHSYWDKTTTGQSTSHGGTGLTDTQMKQQSNFIGFDFTNTWVQYDGHTYPLLRHFMTALTVMAAAQTKAYDGTSTVSLNSPTYSVSGAASSGHLFGLSNAYGNNAVNVGTYSKSDLWSDQQGYIIDQSGVGGLTITHRAQNGDSASSAHGAAGRMMQIGYTVPVSGPSVLLAPIRFAQLTQASGKPSGVEIDTQGRGVSPPARPCHGSVGVDPFAPPASAGVCAGS